MRKPNVNSESEKELDRLEKDFDKYDEQVKSLTLDEMNKAPALSHEPQTKIALRDIDKKPDIYLKPERTIGGIEKFNEEFRAEYNYQKEYVHFIAENHEIIGETIECWTKRFPGVPGEFWKVPVNKPVWGPRYLAEQLATRKYHVLSMDQTQKVADDGYTQMYGMMVAKQTKQRLNATPVIKQRSVFMGATAF